MYGNPVYYEASDTRGKDVLGKEQVMANSLPLIIVYFNLYAYAGPGKSSLWNLQQASW